MIYLRKVRDLSERHKLSELSKSFRDPLELREMRERTDCAIYYNHKSFSICANCTKHELSTLREQLKLRDLLELHCEKARESLDLHNNGVIFTNYTDYVHCASYAL